MNEQEQLPLKRSNVGLLHCDCCSLAIDAQAGEDCPSCGYPISPLKEKRFLTSAIRDLQRVATHGGANITVAGLLRRYQTRLNYLNQFDVTPAPASPPVVPPSKVASATWPAPPTAKPSEIVPSPAPVSPYEADLSLPYIPYAEVAPPAPPVAPVEKPPKVVSPPPPVAPVVRPARITPATPSVSPLAKSPEVAPPGRTARPVVPPARVAPASQPVAPVVRPTPAVPARERPSFSQLVFSWRSFLADQAITIVASLGAFLVLIGALSFIITAHNTALSFLIVFGVHALFGIVGVSTYRFPNLRVVSRIYTGIYVLLVPLVGFAFYNLIRGHVNQLAPPVVIAIAAAYAAIVYSALAISQRFALFGYLGAMALVVTDLAVAGALHLGYWWWPSMLMLLALPALVSVGRPSGRQFFTGHLMVLRDPVRIFMFTIVGVCALGIIITTFYSLVLDGFGAPAREIRFSILSMMLLLSLWTSLYLWLTRRTKWVLVLAYLFLASVLAFCYALNFEHVGYALALTGVALVYHGLSRFAGRLLQPFDKLGLRLDILALLLVAFVPLISAPLLPLQLLIKVYLPTALGGFPFYFQTTWEIVGTLLAVGASLVLSLSVAFSGAGLQSTPGTRRNRWPWLLLLSGVLLNWEYGQVVLALNSIPVWWFLGLTLALVAGAVVVRRRFGSYWANPLDVLALAEAILTLSLSLVQPDSLWSLLLLFAALSYGVVLYQRRQNWLFLPVAFALLAFPILIVTHRLQVILLMGLVLPLAAVAVRRLMPANLVTLGSGLPTNQRVTLGWEWPLLTIALLSGIIVSSFDVVSSASTVQNWLPFPVAVELATFSLAWYVSAALARVKWWLLPVIGFAVVTLLLPSNPFPVLAGVMFVSAALAVGISRFAGRDWASPLYIVTLLAAVMTGITGHTQHQLPATTWVLLGFALLVYIIGVLEDWTPWLWIMPVFAIWSLVDSVLPPLRDLLRPPTLVLVCAGVGMAIGVLKLFAVRRNRFVRYVLPLYTTAFVAAVLTGVYGTLGSVNNPFPGAVPVALLLYAAVAYAVLLFERQSRWLGLVVGFAIWGTLLATRIDSYAVLGISITAVYDVLAIGIGLGIVGLLLSRVVKLPTPNAVVSVSGYDLVKFSWGWPWYVTALVAAVVTGIFASLPMAAWALLAFAVLVYIIGVVEDWTPWLWIAPIFAIWSLIDSAALLGDLYRPPTVVLVCAAAGMAIGLLKLFARRRNRFVRYVLPFYTTAFIAAVLTGVYGTLGSVNTPFPGAVPVALLLYAAVAYGVVLFERQPKWLGLVAGFAIWGTLLATRTASYAVLGISVTPVYDVLAIGIALGIVGLLLSRVVKLPALNVVLSASGYDFIKFTWGWPWYVTALVAAIVTGAWPSPVPLFIGYSLLTFALLFYIIGVVEDQVSWLCVASALAIWSLIDSALMGDLFRLITVALICATLGLATRLLGNSVPPFSGSNRGNKLFGYALPFYVTALAAAILAGIYGTLPVAAWALLVFAALAYIIGIAEDSLLCLWIAPVFATWSLIDSTLLHDFYRLPTVALACVALGVAIRNLTRFIPVFGDSMLGNTLLRYRNGLLRYALPFYAAALAAAVLTGIYGMLPGVNPPFYAAVTAALLLYAAVAYGVLRFEGRPKWLWLVPGFAIWGMLLAPQAVMIYSVVGVGIAAGLVGLLMGRVMKQATLHITTPPTLLTWSWPWYLTTLVAAAVTGAWPFLPVEQPVVDFIRYSLLAFMALSVVIMLVERIPEALVFPVGLGGLVGLVNWATGQHHWAPWQLMGAFSLLCVLLFASQFIWKVIPPATNWLPATLLHRVFGLGGQALVVLIVIGRGGLSADAWPLVQVGVGGLFLLALLLFWYGRLQNAMIVRRWCNYGAGLLISLVIPWELTAFRQTSFELLTLAPASYLIVVAPFLMRDESLPAHQRIGRVVSMLGSALLLLPTLWLSFSSGDSNQLYTLILLGESLVLLLLGLGMLVRIFVLAGAGLVVVAALHALFLSTSSTPLALTGLGMILLLVATGLALARRWLQAAWARWQ